MALIGGRGLGTRTVEFGESTFRIPSSAPVRIELIGYRELLRMLEGLPERVQRKYMRQGVRAAGAKIISSIRKVTPRSRTTGTQKLWSRSVREKRGGVKDALRRSLHQVPSSKWRSSASVAKKGIIGTTVGHLYAWSQNPTNKPIGPHSHLVEQGHKLVAWGRRTNRHVRPHPYFKRGYEAGKGPALEAMKAKLRQGLARERAKKAGM